MTTTSITMYETAEAGFSPVPLQGTTTLTTALYWAQGAPAPADEWRDVVTARLAELERLAPGWDSDGGVPVRRRHSNRAVHFLVRLTSSSGAVPIPIPDIVPLVDGGVQLEWHIAPGVRVDFVSDEDNEPVVLAQDPAGLTETPARLVNVAELRALLEG